MNIIKEDILNCLSFVEKWTEKFKSEMRKSDIGAFQKICAEIRQLPDVDPNYKSTRKLWKKFKTTFLIDSGECDYDCNVVITHLSSVDIYRKYFRINNELKLQPLVKTLK